MTTYSTIKELPLPKVMSFSNRLIFVSLLFAFHTSFHISFESSFYGPKQYGSPCKGSCNYISYLTCQEGICQCLSVAHITYNKNAEMKCWLRRRIAFDKTCVEPCDSDQFCNTDYVCQCKGTKILIEKKCHEAVYVAPMDRCFVENYTAHLCDHKKLSFCKRRRCICFSDYYFNSTSATCELKTSSSMYQHEHAYKAKPGDYCIEDSDCIDGLQCRINFTCTCPSSCPYKKDEEICDCGKVDLQAPAAIVWVGVIIGLLSTIFWIWCIGKTYKSRNQKEFGNTGLDLGTTNEGLQMN